MTTVMLDAITSVRLTPTHDSQVLKLTNGELLQITHNSLWGHSKNRLIARGVPGVSFVSR